MPVIKCLHCDTNFKTISALNSHKKKAQYCLLKQGKIKTKEKVIFKCNLCEKILSTKQRLESHIEKCGKKVEAEAEV